MKTEATRHHNLEDLILFNTSEYRSITVSVIVSM